MAHSVRVLLGKLRLFISYHLIVLHISLLKLRKASGDGWKFRGRGALQLTGKANYQAFASYIGRPEVMDNPDLVSGELCFESALWFFDRNKLWSICDQGVGEGAILALTKRINGGTHGLDDRRAKTKKYAAWL
jgi:putative chitinase